MLGELGAEEKFLHSIPGLNQRTTDGSVTGGFSFHIEVNVGSLPGSLAIILSHLGPLGDQCADPHPDGGLRSLNNESKRGEM